MDLYVVDECVKWGLQIRMEFTCPEIRSRRGVTVDVVVENVQKILQSKVRLFM